MKKRRILLGLALAAAAVFSLSACGDDEKPAETPTTEDGGKTPDSGSTVTAKYKVTYHTTRGTAPAALSDVTKLPDTLPTLTDDEYNFLGWSKTENGTTLVTAGSAISANTDLYAVWQEKEKFTITYHTAHGTAPDALANVRALPETLPTLTDVEYNFVGWTATENGTELVTAGSAISANTDLYAVWTEKGAYDKFVSVATNNQTLILNENFNETTFITKLGKDEDAENVGVFNKPSTKGTPKDGSKYDLEVSDGKAVATDNDATVNPDDSTNNGKTQAIISYGYDNVYKKIEGYVDVTLASEAGSWTFMQLVGTDNSKNSGEVFGLRTVSVKKDNKTTVYIKYRVDGGSETDPENSVVVTANATYGILYSIDLVNSKITVKIVTKTVAGQETITDFVTDKEVAGLMHAEYMNIQSSDKNSNLFSIDNVAVSAVEYEVSEYKELMLNMYTPYLEQMASSYTTNSAAFNTWKEKFIAAIQNATTIEEIKAVEDMDSDLMKEFLEIKTDIQIAVESAISEIDTKYGIDKTGDHISAPNYTINESTFFSTYDEKLRALYDCTTVEAVTTAKNAAITALDAIQKDADAKAGYISSVVQKLQETFPASNYSYDDSTYNNLTEYNNILASITGDNKKAIDDSASAALLDLLDLDTNDELLAQAKTDYKNAASAYRTDLTGKTLDSSEKAAVAAYYTGDTFTTKLATVKNALDAETVTTITAIKSAYDSFTASVDTDVNALVMSIDELKADRIAQITNVDLPAAKVGQSADVQALLDAAATNATKSDGTIMTAASKDDVKAKYQKCLDEFALIIYKNQKKAAFKTWITETYGTGAEKEIKTTNTTALADLQEAEDDVMVLIDLAESKDAIDAEFADGKTLYESEYQALLQYEFTVTYANTTITSGNVVYGNAITKPTDPEVDANHIFVGWYADALFETAFDFTELRYDDVTLYAKIVDAVTVTLNYNTKINNVTTKAIKIEKNGKLSTDDLNVTQSGAKLVGWYDSDDFTTTKYDENTVINSSLQLYAKWHDLYVTTETKVSVSEFITGKPSSSKDITADTTYGDFTVSKGEHSKFKWHKDGFIDLFIGNTITFEVQSNNAVFMLSYYGNNSSRKVILTSTNPEYSTTTKYTKDFTAGNTKYTYNGVEYTLDASQKGWLIFEGLKAGTYTVTFGSDESSNGVGSGEQKIERMRLFDTVTIATEIKEIKASIANDANLIKVSDVKLVDIDDNEIAITEGYYVSVVNSANEVVENWQGALPAGNYKVYVKYGSFTQILGLVQINGMA